MTVSAPRVPTSPDSASSTPGGSWSGLLMIDKPTGMTSHDVVDRVRRRLRIRTVGHLGTLDPGASGLLLVAVGAATRCASVWQGGDKTYEGVVRLGVVTSTQDLSGEILEQHPVAVDEAAMRVASKAFMGEFDQIPPMVSALKVGGQRLYRLALRGIEVDRAPRRVRVEAWEWLGFALPEATFRVRCSAGTYVRTLAHDLGQRLGCGGALRSLRRLRSEPFALERPILLGDLDTRTVEEVWAAGVALADALAVLPAVLLEPADADPVGHGIAVSVLLGAVRPADLGPAAGDDRLPLNRGPRSVVLRGSDGRPLALGELTAGTSPETLLAHPHVVFPWASRQGRG